MIFREMYLRLNDLAGQPLSGDFETLGKMYLNFVYRRLLDLGRIRHESRTFTLTTRAGEADYGLPLYVRRVESVIDRANERNLYSSSAKEMDELYPAYATEGTPRKCFPIGTFGVERQPTETGTIQVVSSSALDSGANFLTTLVGFDVDGRMVRESVQMSGVIPVSSSGSFVSLERLVKTYESSAFSGNLILLDSVDVTLAEVPIWWDSPDYLWISFYPIPDEVLTYAVRAEMRKPPLVEDDDWPEIEQDYHDLIVIGAAVDLLPKVGMTNAAMVLRSTYKDRLREYLSRQKDEFDTARTVTFRNVTRNTGGMRRVRFEI